MTCGFMPRKHEERINFLSLRQTQLTLQTKFSLEYQAGIITYLVHYFVWKNYLLFVMIVICFQ